MFLISQIYSHSSIQIIFMSKQPTEQAKLLAGSIASGPASIIAKFICHPIDTIKSKIQVSRIQIRTPNDIKLGQGWSLCLSTWKQEGIRGFFRGVTISAFGSVIAFTAYLRAYEESKRYLLKHYVFLQKSPTFAHFISGICAQIASCIFWLPIDIIKERMQVQSQIKVYSYSSPKDAVLKIHKSEGIIGLYRAFGATIVFFGPFSAIFFSLFEKFKKMLVAVQGKPTLTESIICSSAASGLAGLITTPLEIVKLRMQIQRADVAKTGGKLQNSIFGYKNIFHGLYLAWKNQGFFALYKGGFLRICFVVPITTLCMSLTEYFKQELLRREWVA